MACIPKETALGFRDISKFSKTHDYLSLREPRMMNKVEFKMVNDLH